MSSLIEFIKDKADTILALQATAFFMVAITVTSMEFPSFQKWLKHNFFYLMDSLTGHTSYISRRSDAKMIGKFSEYLEENGVRLTHQNTKALSDLVHRGDLAILIRDRQFRSLETR